MYVSKSVDSKAAANPLLSAEWTRRAIVILGPGGFASLSTYNMWCPGFLAELNTLPNGYRSNLMPDTRPRAN
jgi:hypothetical protein